MTSTAERLGPYFMALRGESDRGLVIILAAYLDDLLKELLTAFLVDCPKVVRQVLESDGPLGTFASRARMALCLGFITEDELSDIDLIRRCRNDAAHIASVVDFSSNSAPLAQRCENFRTLSEQCKASTPDARERFMLVAAWIAIKIDYMRESMVRRLPPSVPEDMKKLADRALILWVSTAEMTDVPRK